MRSWPIELNGAEPNRMTNAPDPLTHAPAANTAAILTITPTAVEYVAMQSIEWSYDGVPSSGSLIITVAGATVWTEYITAAGPGHFDWSMAPRIFAAFASGIPTKGGAVVVTLAAGGAGISGSVNARYL